MYNKFLNSTQVGWQ